MQGLNAQNYKSPMKEIKENEVTGETCCDVVGGFSIVRLSVLPKMFYRFTTISVKILSRFFFFVDVDKLTVKQF